MELPKMEAEDLTLALILHHHGHFEKDDDGKLGYIGREVDIWSGMDLDRLNPWIIRDLFGLHGYRNMGKYYWHELDFNLEEQLRPLEMDIDILGMVINGGSGAITGPDGGLAGGPATTGAPAAAGGPAIAAGLATGGGGSSAIAGGAASFAGGGPATGYGFAGDGSVVAGATSQLLSTGIQFRPAHRRAKNLTIRTKRPLAPVSATSSATFIGPIVQEMPSFCPRSLAATNAPTVIEETMQSCFCGNLIEIQAICANTKN